jgi:hypothetical protein
MDTGHSILQHTMVAYHHCSALTSILGILGIPVIFHTTMHRIPAIEAEDKALLSNR